VSRAVAAERASTWAWTADIVLAVVLAAGTMIYARRTGHEPLLLARPGGRVELIEGPQTNPAHLLVGAFTALPLVLRRHFPLAVFLTVATTTLYFQHVTNSADARIFTFASCLIAAYGAAIYSPHRKPAVISLGLATLLIAGFHDALVPTISPGFVPFLLLLPIGLAANTIQVWRERMSAMAAEQEAATRRAVEQERARIARDLHDVVTHNVSVMVVQAGAARVAMETAPDAAGQALLAVEAGGRAAMAELRHVMGLLTMSSGGAEAAEADDLAPQPGLAQVPALAGRIDAAGTPVELTVTGTPDALPSGVDLAAYRVVQEALTNTVKHAAGARVAIAIDHRPGAVQVEVADTGGAASASSGSGNGRGLIGLRERLAIYGGTLEAGPRPTGGYRVRAVIPVPLEPA
jgi:signal transduction histidine kinase